MHLQESFRIRVHTSTHKSCTTHRMEFQTGHYHHLQPFSSKIKETDRKERMHLRKEIFSLRKIHGIIFLRELIKQ